jgi:ribosome maturation factor RimP
LRAENGLKITGGLISPLFYYKKMIDKKEIAKIVDEIIQDETIFKANEIFIVQIKVSKDKVIQVFVDKMQGISIDECVKISKEIEKRLNRDEEDFELQVSSPGIDKPFRVKQQYLKNINKEVQILTVVGNFYKGILSSVQEESINLIQNKEGERLSHEGFITLNFNEIKETRLIIKF